MIRNLILFEFQKFLTYFKNRTLAKVITTALFLAIFFFVGSGIYFFFVTGFRFVAIESSQEIYQALSLFLYEMFFVILSGVVLFSVVISALFSLFKGERNAWILSSPMYTVFPKFIFIKSIFVSLLPASILFVPAIFAFHKAHALSLLAVLSILISLALLLVTLSASVFIFILLLGKVCMYVSTSILRTDFTFKKFLIIIFGIVATCSFFAWRLISSVDIVKLFRAEDDTVPITADLIAQYFYGLPTHFLAEEMLHWQNKDNIQALTSLLFLALVTATLTYVFWKISTLFYPLWQKFQEGSIESKRTLTSSMYEFTGSPLTALYKKELLIFTRNFKGILWFFFLLFLWLIQIATNVVLEKTILKYQTDLSEKMAALLALQFIIAMYFISSFALRFVFPSFSTEKKTSWILGSAPLSFRKIFFGKLFFYSSLFVVLGSVMSYINSTVVGASFLATTQSLILSFVTSLGIIVLALSLSALFPNKDTDDAEVITTSMPGLFFTATALLYGALAAWILYKDLFGQMHYVMIGHVLLTLFFIVALPKYVLRLRVASR